MLTDIDIHYLVGLLTRVQEADDVTVELGDMVYDSAASKKRDVDITVLHTGPDGTKSVYKGVEVKKHNRPLDIQIVEQLCLKLADMPDITHKGIVSASGYTDGAKSKAQAHGVELLEIVDWVDPSKGFNVKFVDSVFTLIEPEWTDGPHVSINVSEENRAELSEKYSSGLKIHTASGKPYPGLKNTNDLFLYVHRAASNKLEKQTDPTVTKHGESKPVKSTILFKQTPYIRLVNKLVAVEDCLVTGRISYRVHDKPLLKVLRKTGSSKPLTGCVLVETKNHNLIGVSVSNLNNKITALNIPHTDRIKRKIHKRRI